MSKRKRTESVAAPAALDTDSSSYRPCQHLVDYKDKQGAKAFRSFQKSVVPGPPGRASIRREDNEVPRCSSCGRSSGRLYACLVCSLVGCWAPPNVAHARLHAQTCPGHELAVDLDRAELFCCSCDDQVYDRDFDRMVLCAQVRGSVTANSPPSPSPGALRCYARQKKGAEYRPWVPSSKEQLALKHGCTPLKDDSCLPSGLRGLNNMGNTCFMNSVLQAFLHTPPLRNYFLSDRHNRNHCQSKALHLCLGCDMDAIFSAAFSGERSPYSPAQFLYSWWQHSSNLAGYEQQDAHDFFISTVEGIHANSEGAPRAGNGHSGNDQECRCIVHRVFSGQLRSDITCTACGFTSTTYDPCVDISLDLEGRNPAVEYSTSSTLLGCLDRFTRPEKLGCNETLYCESCQVRREFIKQMSIRKLPLVLCFHIKRFEQHPVARNYSSRKVDRYVQFPMLLDMAAFLSSSIVRLRHGNRMVLQDEAAAATTTSSPSSEFELFAVVTHSGKLDAGHYISYLRLAGQWYKCDDAWVSKVSESVVRAAQAYMLYYVQKTLSYKASASSNGGYTATRQSNGLHA